MQSLAFCWGTEINWSFELSHHRRARVWLDEFPNAVFPGVSVARLTLATEISALGATRCATVELFAPSGGRYEYGLLGAEIEDGEGKGREVEVIVHVIEKGRSFQDSLANLLDEVCVGLPEEYVVGVLSGAEKAVSEKGATARQIRFRCAAHGRRSSSIAIFEELGSLVVRLLALPSVSKTAEVIREVLEDRNLNRTRSTG